MPASPSLNMVWSSASRTLIGLLAFRFSAITPRSGPSVRLESIVASVPCRATDVRPFLSLFTRVRGIGQPVEKVVVGPGAPPIESENKSKTLQKRRIRPPTRGHKRARGSFSTRWHLPRTRVNGPVSRAQRGEALRRKSSISYLQMEPSFAPVSLQGSPTLQR
jgi:hypothetical protein